MKGQYDQELLVSLVKECTGHVLFRPYAQDEHSQCPVYGNVEFAPASDRQGKLLNLFFGGNFTHFPLIFTWNAQISC